MISWMRGIGRTVRFLWVLCCAAVDGWRVDNMVQYRTVRAFPLDGGFTLTVARGATRLPVTIANRAFVPDFRIANYPVQGWIEK